MELVEADDLSARRNAVNFFEKLRRIRTHPTPSPVGQCHQLKTGAFVLCEKTAKRMQLVGAGLCSARQDTPNYRKSSANPYALTRLAVEADAHIGPAECTVFTGIYSEFVTSQWADRVVGPYNNPSHSL